MGPTPDGNEDVRIHVFKSLDSVDDTLNGRMLTDLRKRSAERTPVLQDALQKLQLFLGSYREPHRSAVMQIGSLRQRHTFSQRDLPVTINAFLPPKKLRKCRSEAPRPVVNSFQRLMIRICSMQTVDHAQLQWLGNASAGPAF